MKIEKDQITAFQEKILGWYGENRRELPWRGTSNPYAILVSEVMSQQTQMVRVVPKYLAWMEAFPTIKALANASTADILSYWSGLGYNRRALFLQKTAKTVHSMNGNWPRTPEELVTLPGIGKYTASAVACFAFHAQIPVIDTNVRKVILLEFFRKSEYQNPKFETTSSDISIHSALVSNFEIRSSSLETVKEKEIEEIAWEILPKGKAKEWNQALMDYASAVLKSEKIPVAKQSPFLGSNRWYRGELLKILTRQQSITRIQLGTLWKKDSEKEDKAWFDQLLSTLEKEGFIMIIKNRIHIAL